MVVKKKKFHPSVLKGEATFQLDERTKKTFGKLVKKAQKHKFDPRQHNQIIICGPEEFAETERQGKTKR